MKKGIVFLLFVLMAVSLKAQNSAMLYFNNGSEQYVHSKIEQAMATVDAGLQKFPNDEKLNALKEKLKEEKKKQQQQDKKEEKEQQKQDQEKEDSEKENKKDQKQEPKKEDKKEEKGDKDSKKEKRPEPKKLKMSPEQIKQLLETMNNEENKTQKKIKAQEVKKGRKKHQEKDW